VTAPVPLVATVAPPATSPAGAPLGSAGHPFSLGSAATLSDWWLVVHFVPPVAGLLSAAPLQFEAYALEVFELLSLWKFTVWPVTCLLAAPLISILRFVPSPSSLWLWFSLMELQGLFFSPRLFVLGQSLASFWKKHHFCASVWVLYSCGFFWKM